MSFGISLQRVVLLSSCAALAASAQDPIKITNDNVLPTVYTDNSYSFQFTAVGGVPPYQDWGINPDRNGTRLLSQGLSVNSSTGVLSGTPSSFVETGFYPFSVTVHDSRGYAATASFFLAISYPPQKIQQVSPLSAVAGGPAFSLSVTLRDFVQNPSECVVRWNQTQLPTTFAAPLLLSAQVSANLIASPGTATVRVLCGDGILSQGPTFTVAAVALPNATSVSPNSVLALSSPVKLTVNGTGFSATDVIVINSSPTPTGYVSPTQLTANPPLAGVDLTDTSRYNVYVQAASGYQSLAGTFEVDAPPVSISVVSPSAIAAGSADTVVTVTGSSFAKRSQVLWNGTGLQTTFLSASLLRATVPAAMLQQPGATAVTVKIFDFSASGGTVSNILNVTVTTTPLNLTGLAPSSILEGATGFTLTATGSGFNAGTSVLWNGTPLATNYLSPTQLSASVTGNLVASAAPAKISLGNNSGSGSNALPFVVGSNLPYVVKLDPDFVQAGKGAFTLTIFGGVYLPAGAVALWNNVPLQTSFVSSSQLTASVPASLIATPGGARVRVKNPGGSDPISFGQVTIQAPVGNLTGIAPNLATAGGGAFTLTVSAGSIRAGTVVQWNGAALPTTLLSGSQATAQITATLIASPGTVLVTLKDSDGSVSNAQPFTIAPPQPIISGLVPSSAARGSSAFMLTVNGSGFLTGATPSNVFWNGQQLVTTFVSLGQLTAAVPSALLETAGVATIQVTTGSVSSVASSFQVLSDQAPANPEVTALVNAATGQAGAIVPGEIVVLYGNRMGPSSLTTLQLDQAGLVSSKLGGTTVLFNGIAAPLLYTSATLVSAVVPYGVGAPNTDVQVVLEDRRSATFRLPVATTSPGIFTANQGGTGQAAAVNQDGTVNDAQHPAAAGSVIVLYLTGEGLTTAPADGRPAGVPLPAPLAPVTATIGFKPATVAYAGGAPGFVAGLMQMNVVIPGDLDAHGSVPLQVTIGGVASNVVTITMQ